MLIQVVKYGGSCEKKKQIQEKKEKKHDFMDVYNDYRN